MFRTRQPSQSIRAEVCELGIAGHQVARRLREEDLAAVAGRADTCGPVDVESQIDAALDNGLTRMQAHADANYGQLRPRVGPDQLLGGDRGVDTVLRPLESNEHLIGAAVDLIAASVRYGCPEQLPELVQDATVAVPQLLDKARRPLDVREEQSHGPARQLGHLYLRPECNSLNGSDARF